jgi:hypothetical protein
LLAARRTGQFCKNIAIRLGIIEQLKKSNLLSKGKAFPFSPLACMPNCCLLPDELLPDELLPDELLPDELLPLA